MLTPNKGRISTCYFYCVILPCEYALSKRCLFPPVRIIILIYVYQIAGIRASASNVCACIFAGWKYTYWFWYYGSIRGSRGTPWDFLQFFDVNIRILPYPFELVIVEKEMYHSVKMILIFQMCLVEADQQQIVEVIFFCFESWDNRNLHLSFTRELVSK